MLGVCRSQWERLQHSRGSPPILHGHQEAPQEARQHHQLPLAASLQSANRPSLEEIRKEERNRISVGESEQELRSWRSRVVVNKASRAGSWKRPMGDKQWAATASVWAAHHHFVRSIYTRYRYALSGWRCRGASRVARSGERRCCLENRWGHQGHCRAR